MEECRRGWEKVEDDRRLEKIGKGGNNRGGR